MLLNVAPPPNSTLPETAMHEYAALGAFISACYGEGQQHDEDSSCVVFSQPQGLNRYCCSHVAT
jgi:hypothetical protein